MTWWQILLAVVGGLLGIAWLADWWADRGAPSDRLAWWKEPRGRVKPHIPTRRAGVDDGWKHPEPTDPRPGALGPEHPVKRRDLPDDTPEWLADAFDLAGVNGMLADLRGQQAWPAPFLGIAVQDLQRPR